MTKDEIATVLNARLKRAETATTLAEEIRAGLAYISADGRWKDLHTSATAALIAGAESFAKPTGFRLDDKITLNDGTSDLDPLDETDFITILKSRSNSPGNTQPYAYCKHGANIELDAACDKAYTATIYYWRYHPDQATILFGEPFREAVFNAVMYKYLEGKKLVDEAIYFRKICGAELDKLRDTEEDSLPIMAKYRDI